MKHRRPRQVRHSVVVLSVIVALSLAVAAGVGFVYVGTGSHPATARDPGQAGGGGGAPQPTATITENPEPNPTSHTPPVATTAQAMLQLLAQLLPPGTTSDAATFDSRDELVADLSYRRNGKTGAIRAVLTLPPGPASSSADRCVPTPSFLTCTQLPNGATMHVGSGLYCRQALVVAVRESDGTWIRLEIGHCPQTSDDDSSTQNQGSGPDPNTVLSLSEAQLIAADDQWGRTVPAALARTGHQRFADARRLRHPFTTTQPRISP